MHAQFAPASRYLGRVSTCPSPLIRLPPDARGNPLYAKLIGAILFASDARAASGDAVECRVPMSSVRSLGRLAEVTRIGQRDRSGFTAIQVTVGPALLNELLTSDGRGIAGVPPRFRSSGRALAVAVVQGAMMVAPPAAAPGGWRMVCPSLERALALVALLRRGGVSARARSSTRGHHVWVAESEKASLHAMGVRLPEPVGRPFGPATGQATLDTLNSQRRAEQEERTRRALEALGEDCPANLRQAAMLRLQYPDLSVEALGLMCDPPKSRHAVNGQLRRLDQLAGQRGRGAE